MKQNVLRVIALSLLVSTAFVILTSLSNAQVARDQNSGTTTMQAAPTEKTVEQVFKNIKVLNGMPQLTDPTTKEAELVLPPAELPPEPPHAAPSTTSPIATCPRSNPDLRRPAPDRTWRRISV